MKIYIDTEFYEFEPYHASKHFSSGGVYTPAAPGGNAVQLISLGAVREDGAEFYAENAEFDWDNVPEDHWIQENVRPHLWHGNEKPLWMLEQNPPKGGRYTPSAIAQAFYEFACTYALHPSGVATPENVRPEFWGYFCDYDWVVLCGLYGRMVDLPEEFPMYCLDLKQEIKLRHVPRRVLPYPEDKHHALADARWIKKAHEHLTLTKDRP